MEQRWPKINNGVRRKQGEDRDDGAIMLGAVLGVIFRSVRLSVFRRPGD